MVLTWSTMIRDPYLTHILLVSNSVKSTQLHIRRIKSLQKAMTTNIEIFEYGFLIS